MPRPRRTSRPPVSYTHLDVYKRQALDNQISKLTREQRDVQRVADNAALESRRDRAEELEGALEEARQAQADAREATETARAALKDLRNRCLLYTSGRPQLSLG